jgi:hypothetical protein
VPAEIAVAPREKESQKTTHRFTVSQRPSFVVGWGVLIGSFGIKPRSASTSR